MRPSYKSLLEVLENAIRELPESPAPVPPGMIAEWIESLPFAAVLKADAACSEFAAKRKWPGPDSLELAQIHLRLEAACDLCRDLAARREALPKISEKDLLRMLLLDFWRGKGIEWAEHRFGRSPIRKGGEMN